MRRWLVLSSAVALLAVVGAVASVASAHEGKQSAPIGSGQSQGNVVVAVGKDYWEPNGFVAATFRWDPGTITVSSGSSVTFEHGRTGAEPHTVTLARKAQLPKSLTARAGPATWRAGT